MMSNEIDELEESIRALEGENDRLQQRADEFENEVESLQEKIAELEVAKAELETDTEFQIKRISSLEEEVESYESEDEFSRREVEAAEEARDEAIEVRKQLIEEMFRLWGVPEHIMGAIDNSNAATIAAAERFFRSAVEREAAK